MKFVMNIQAKEKPQRAAQVTGKTNLRNASASELATSRARPLVVKLAGTGCISC